MRLDLLCMAEKELAKVIGKLRQIDDVIDIERTTG